MGSGLSYHTPRQLEDKTGASEKFDAWLTEAVCHADIAEREARLVRWASAPAARRAHPREDHLIPLMVAAGAAGADLGHTIYSERVPLWHFRSSSFQFGPSLRA